MDDFVRIFGVDEVFDRASAGFVKVGWADLYHIGKRHL